MADDRRGSDGEARLRQFWLPAAAIGTRSQVRDLAIMLVPLPALLVVSMLMGGGLTYTLDDPYIHLTLARNIWHGHYGINLGEWSSPSSSILWPFLLAPFSTLPFFEYVPLPINMLCAGMSLVLLHDLLVRALGYSTLLAPAAAVLALGLNIYGLVFSGMEHSLQVLLAIFIACRLCRGHMDRWFWLAVVLLPLVRYEGLAISLPVCAYGWHKGQRQAAVLAAGSIVAACAAFSAFLLHLGLPFLPLSVLAKSNFGGFTARWTNAGANIVMQPMLLYCVVRLTGYLWKSGHRAEAVMLVGVALLFYPYGRSGLGRYETFVVAFVAVLVLHWWFVAWRPDPVKGLRLSWLLLPVTISPLAFATLSIPTLSTPQATVNIRDQQVQMAEIARRLDLPVAVNDLGVVSFRSGNYVLDLWGLASREAQEGRKNDPLFGWVNGLMSRKGVEVALIYDSWISPRPDRWIRVGELALPGRRVTPDSDTVAIYATNEAMAMRLRSELREYRESSPLARSITRIF